MDNSRFCRFCNTAFPSPEKTINTVSSSWIQLDCRHGFHIGCLIDLYEEKSLSCTCCIETAVNLLKGLGTPGGPESPGSVGLKSPGGPESTGSVGLKSPGGPESTGETWF